ncbi:MAG: hypothetical protein H8E55_56675 [Pelagibacterales bacterium]|nr:hypothetical protein [Pelagibacterales bacterium]
MVESIQEFVKDKSIVFVGNSVEIMNHKLADVINSYDIVVRFGRAMQANKLQEESIGTKVDIWVTGQFRAPIYNEMNEEFTKGKYKDVKILVNRCRGNFGLKDWVFEDHLPKGMPYTQMYTDQEIIDVMKSFGKNILGVKELRPSAGFLTILWFINKVKTYKSLDLIGFDFFAKSIKERARDKRGALSAADPHSWHLPVYMVASGAHDKDMEQQYMSFLERRGLLKWNLLSDLKERKIKYTGWMKGMKIIKSAPKISKVSKI